MRIELEPDVLVQSGQMLGSIGSQLGMLADALGEALGSGIASGMDPAGADFGIKYGHQAQDFAKGMADATDAHEAVGFMLEATGYNYENAEAASTIGGSGPTGKMGAAPDKSAVADATGINGAMVPPPAKWALIQTFLGPMWSWPSGNASMMRITAAQWRNFANGLSAFDGEMSVLKGTVSQQHIPEAGKIGDALTDLAEGVDNMAQSATAMAKAVDDFARGVQDTQDAIRDLMDRISLDGLWDTVTGFLTGDGDDILREVADDVKQLLENFQSQVKGVVGLLGELANLLGSAADSFQKWVRPILVEALGDDVGNAVADYVTWNTDVGVGVVTGLINTVSGVVSLADLDTWKGLAEVAASVAEDPTKLPGVLENMGKQFVAWDEWSGDHPGRAAGEAAFNIGMLFVPGGALAKGGGVAKSLSYANRLFEEGRIPRLSDLPGLGGASHGLPGFEGVPGARAGIPEFNPGAVPDSIVSPSTPGGVDAPTSPASVGGSGEPSPDSSAPPGGPSQSGPGSADQPTRSASAEPSSSTSPSVSEPSAPSHAASSGDSAPPAPLHAAESSNPATSNGAGPSTSEGGSPNGHGGGGSGVGDGNAAGDNNWPGSEQSDENPSAHAPTADSPGGSEPPATDGRTEHQQPDPPNNPPHTGLYDPPSNHGVAGESLPDLTDVNAEYRLNDGSVDPDRFDEWTRQVADAYPEISQDGVAGVYDYTTENYQGMNPYLRDVDPLSPEQQSVLDAESLGEMTDAQRASWEDRISDTDDGLASLPPYRADPTDATSTTWRGMHASDELLAQLDVGDTFRDHAYLSTSLDSRVAEDFALSADPTKTPTLLSIEGYDGVDVSQLSRYTREAEILFPRGSEFEVISRELGDNGVIRIVLRQIHP